MTDFLTPLVERLEAAEGLSPDDLRRLDGELDVAVMDAEGEQWPARYTSSIDAALTLVPEGFEAWDLKSYKGKMRFLAGVYRLGNSSGPDCICDGDATTPALALCIAALKARNQTENTHE